MARKKPKSTHHEAEASSNAMSDRTDRVTGKGKVRAVAKHDESAIDFPKFPNLPAELRMMIIQDALHEDEKRHPARVVLFDHHTYRISPLVEQSKDLSSLLFVNAQFREAALKIYCMLEVIDVGVPYVGEFGDAENWHNEDGELEYSLDIAQMIDTEGDGEGEFYEGPKGHVYIRPEIDIFLTGLIPRQISETPIFSYLLDAGPNERWIAPICHVTERLPLSACARISRMRDLIWDPGCPVCGEHHPIHCRECFLEGKGKALADPAYDMAVYSNVKEFGIYAMGGGVVPEILMYDLAVGENPTQEFLEEMNDNYIVCFTALA